jgi:hypothetical protein
MRRLDDSPIRNVLAHVEHRAGMVGQCRRRRQEDLGLSYHAMSGFARITTPAITVAR